MASGVPGVPSTLTQRFKVRDLVPKAELVLWHLVSEVWGSGKRKNI